MLHFVVWYDFPYTRVFHYVLSSAQNLAWIWGHLTRVRPKNTIDWILSWKHIPYDRWPSIMHLQSFNLPSLTTQDSSILSYTTQPNAIHSIVYAHIELIPIIEKATRRYIHDRWMRLVFFLGARAWDWGNAETPTSFMTILYPVDHGCFVSKSQVFVLHWGNMVNFWRMKWGQKGLVKECVCEVSRKQTYESLAGCWWRCLRN